MGEIHRLIAEHGRAKAIQLDFDRRVVDAATHYMGMDDGEIGFLYSGWAQSALPHRRLPDDTNLQVQTDYVTLIVQPGLRPSPTGVPTHVGVPYGSRARLICIYLQSEALKTNSREVEQCSIRQQLRLLKTPVIAWSFVVGERRTGFDRRHAI